MRHSRVRLLLALLAGGCGSSGGTPAAPDAGGSTAPPDAPGPPDAGVAEACRRPAIPTGPEWTEGRYFPRFPEARHVYVLPVETDIHRHEVSWRRDWRITDSPPTMHAVTLVAMQGTINRETPCVYLEWVDPVTNEAPFWAGELGKHVTVERVDVRDAAAIGFLHQRFADRFTGAVVYDPEIPDTLNVAMMLAGLEDRLVLAPAQLGMPGIPELSSVTDLGALAAAEGWDATPAGRTRLYQWVYDNLWPRLDKRIVGVVSPGPPSSGHIFGGEPELFFPLGLAARDYLVALRASALWLVQEDPAQRALLDRFLADVPSPVPVTGGYDEVSLLEQVSENGDWVALLTWPNAPLSAGNLTALGAVAATAVPYQATIDPARILATLGTAPVAAVYTSDGDNLGFQMSRGFWGADGNSYTWDSPRGKRMGWTMNPVLADLAPMVWSYYVQSAGPVSLVTGLSGAGYVFPRLMDDAELGAYLDRTREYLQRTGLRVIHLDPRGDTTYANVGPLYGARLAGSGYLGSFAGFGQQSFGLNVEYPGIPAPGVTPLGYDSLAQAIADLPGRRVGEVTLRLADWPNLATAFGGEIVADASAPGGRAVKLARTLPTGLRFTSANDTLPAGRYTVRYTLKVADRSSASAVAALFAGINLPSSFEFLVREELAATDFAEAGAWQTFAISFTLDAQTPAVVVRLDGFEGVTDLFLATIEIERDEPYPLPLFAPIFVNLVGPEPKSGIASAVDQLEAAGVVVVTPEELVAALNPEFMIAFAEPRLGAGHAALATARAQLDAGRYLDALLTIRAALAGP